MLPGLPDLLRGVRSGIWVLWLAAGALALAATACEVEPPPSPTISPLTPPAAVARPTTAVTALRPTELPIGASESALASPAVPADVVARTEERMAELTARMTRPRRVDADVLWAVFLMTRTFGIGTGGPPDIEAPAKMLEMWHPDNVCYAMATGEVDQLGADNHLTPVDFNAFVAHVEASLSPCLDEQWAAVDAEQFFANPLDLRTDRVSVWFDTIWEFSNSEALTNLDHCRDGFYVQLPVAESASDSHALEAAWATAMVDFSACRRESMREELPFMELNETRMFAFELGDRYTLISLQTTVAGHLVGIALQRPYDACWPDFEAGIPEVAGAADPAQLVESGDAALGALRDCIEALPEYRPFATR